MKAILVAMAIVVIVLAAGFVTTYVNSSSSSLKIVSWYYRENRWYNYGYAFTETCTVNVTNNGRATGSGIIRCEVQAGDLTYNGTQAVSLSPQESGTYTVVITIYDWVTVTAVTCRLTKS